MEVQEYNLILYNNNIGISDSSDGSDSSDSSGENKNKTENCDHGFIWQ